MQSNPTLKMNIEKSIENYILGTYDFVTLNMFIYHNELNIKYTIYFQI